jgi:hypothetical protein
MTSLGPLIVFDQPGTVEPWRQSFREIAEFLSGQQPDVADDRVLATVLFTDIVDSTRRAAEIGDPSSRSAAEIGDPSSRSAALISSRACRASGASTPSTLRSRGKWPSLRQR